MLLPRVLTALVGIPLFLFLIHWGGTTFAVFSVGVSALCLYEYGLILSLGGRPVQRATVVAAGTAIAACLAFSGPLDLVVCASVACVVLLEMASAEPSLDRAALTVFGALLLGWMPVHLALIRDLRPAGERLTLMFVVSVWLMDTAAYFVGTRVGRRRLAPVLSPKKTWEGFVAGLGTALATVFLFKAASPGLLSPERALAVGLVIGLGGQVSDLAESMVKRSVGAKDSGALLPGHGGVMDRFDSFILAAPAVYYCMRLP